MVAPAAKRAAVGAIQDEFRISQRRASKLMGIGRSTSRYRPRRRPDEPLETALRDVAREHPRWGYRMLTDVLRGRGLVVNHKKIFRLYRSAGLLLPRRRPRKGRSAARRPLPVAAASNSVWALDFVSDALSNGRRFRCLTITDTFDRRCPGILVDSSIGGRRVARFLDELGEREGLPTVLISDNGPEFTSRAMFEWAMARGVELRFIEPGKPMQNGFIESFNGKFRNECLDVNWFVSLVDARRRVEVWRGVYNEIRPHSSLGGIPPAEFAARQREPGPPGLASLAPPPPAPAGALGGGTII